MRPEGVRIVKNGIEFEPELRHLGVDADGMDCWVAVFEGRFVANEDQLKVAVLPARTSIGLDASLPPSLDPEGELSVHYSVQQDGCSNLNTSQHTEGETA